jgi:hypothetical protein
VNRTFPLDARSLAEIFYAPDHVRVWRTETYRALGGHDATLAVCDDFDLICRTYLSGAKFAYIADCLYLYRIRGDGGNTWIKRNAEIQKTQAAVSRKYVRGLTVEWCRREGLPLYDLATRASTCCKASMRWPGCARGRVIRSAASAPPTSSSTSRIAAIHAARTPALAVRSN